MCVTFQFLCKNPINAIKILFDLMKRLIIKQTGIITLCVRNGFAVQKYDENVCKNSKFSKKFSSRKIHVRHELICLANDSILPFSFPKVCCTQVGPKGPKMKYTYPSIYPNVNLSKFHFS